MTSWMHLFLDLPRADVDHASAFWASATGTSLSPWRGESGQFATLVPASGPAWVKLQAVPGASGVHLDLDSENRPAAVARSLAFGALSAWTYAGVPVHRSPGGFVFCHTLAEGSPLLERSGGSLLDQVCLDVPSRLWDREVSFWSALTGREARQGSRPEFVSLAADGQPRILMQRLDDDAPIVTGHPDFAVADRPGEVARHESLGAVRMTDFERWTVLRAPGGQAYCLTDRDPRTGRVEG